ncbi:MAG: sensor histidine kinase [Clostridiaceae bacterium]|nr:sensor histidine kinase [Clostridiaceae bacterium]
MERFKENLNICKKLVIIYVPIIILTVFVCFASFVNLIEKRTIKEFGTFKITSLKHIADKNENMIENTIYISNSYLFNNEIKDYVNMKDDETPYDRVRKYDKAKLSLIDNENIFYNLDYYITFLGIGNDNYITTSKHATREQDRERQDYIESIINQNRTSLVWSPAYSCYGENIISAVRYLVDVRTGKQIGIMIFDFPETVFSKAYDEYLDTGEYIEIVKGDGQLMSSSDKTMLGKSIRETELFQEIQGFKEGYFYSEEENSIVAFAKIDKMDWYIISSTPLEVVLSSFHDVRQTLALILIVTTLIFLMLTVVASRFVAVPIVNLAHEIREYHGKEGETEEKTPKNEVRYLHGEYKKMTERIEHLISRILTEQEEKRISEIEALQAQINPHFLYNTLQSIRNLNRLGERESIDKVIVALVRLLSELLHNKESMHTVLEEIRFLKDYVYIQQVRYGHNFEVVYDCPQETEGLAIPKLILQPIIENAIFHGLSGLDEGGIIRICTAVNEELLEIVIEDNGAGFDSSGLGKKEEGEPVKNGIALENIKNRLRLLYGEKAGLVIKSRVGEGTWVMVRIPARMGEGR